MPALTRAIKQAVRARQTRAPRRADADRDEKALAQRLGHPRLLAIQQGDKPRACTGTASSGSAAVGVGGPHVQRQKSISRVSSFMPDRRDQRDIRRSSRPRPGGRSLLLKTP